MSKHVSKFLCALLALILIFSTVACMAETIRRTYYDYEKKNSTAPFTRLRRQDLGIQHRSDGRGRGPAIPMTRGEYTEEAALSMTVSATTAADNESTTTTTTTTTTTETTETAEQFTNASGITVAVGAPAAETLKQVFAAIPANTEVSFDGVDKAVADALIAAINEGATPAELLEILANFPTQLIDGVHCYVVTISYTDAAGTPVTENYAFSTADGTLVKVF